MNILFILFNCIIKYKVENFIKYLRIYWTKYRNKKYYLSKKYQFYLNNFCNYKFIKKLQQYLLKVFNNKLSIL